MGRRYKVYQVDSFTGKKFSGNPAGVVLDANGLSQEEMLLLARELKNSETAFIFTPGENERRYDIEVRFFTPLMEVPVCGHATVAAHYVLAVEKRTSPGDIVCQKTMAGILPVKVEKTGNDFKIRMTQGAVEFSTISENYQEQIIEALGLCTTDIDQRCPVEIASTGHSKVMIGINSREKLNLLSPDLSKLKELSACIHCNGYFVFTFDSHDPAILVHGRMFAPALGIDEDPVTGNANGPLGAYLVKNKLAEHNGKLFSFKAKQGEALNREGTVDVFVFIHHGSPVKVEIEGMAVIVFQTYIEL